MEQNEPQKLELTPINVTLNRPDVAELDRLARAGQTNRSQLVRQAIQDFLQSGRAEKSSRFPASR